MGLQRRSATRVVHAYSILLHWDGVQRRELLIRRETAAGLRVGCSVPGAQGTQTAAPISITRARRPPAVRRTGPLSGQQPRGSQAHARSRQAPCSVAASTVASSCAHASALPPRIAGESHDASPETRGFCSVVCPEASQFLQTDVAFRAVFDYRRSSTHLRKEPAREAAHRVAGRYDGRPGPGA